MSEKHLVCKGATVYCSKSIINNNPGSAIPLNITSQNTVVINDGKVVATEKDCTALNMNFGMCNNGSSPPPPCTANVQWSNLYEGANVTDAGLKLLIEESKGICSCAGGQIKISYHGQIATLQNDELDSVVPELMWGILPLSYEKIHITMELPRSRNPITKWRKWRERRKESKARKENIKNSESSKNGVSIKILDDTTPVNNDFRQIVNLPIAMFNNIPKKSRFFDKGSKEPFKQFQLGTRIKYRITFEDKTEGDFKLYLVTNAENMTYSAAEQNRNENFRYKIPNCSNPKDDLESDPNIVLLKNIIKNPKAGTKIEGELYLTLAGGNKYQLLIKNSGESIAHSVEVTTWRMLFFVELKMNKSSSAIKKMTMCISEYYQSFIILKCLGRENLNYMGNISDAVEKPQLKKRLDQVYLQYQKQSPYFIVIAQVENVTEKKEVTLKFELNAGEKTMEVLIKSDRVHPLWKDISGSKDSEWLGTPSFFEWSNNNEWVEITHPLKCKITPVKKEYDGYFHLDFTLSAPHPRDLSIVLTVAVIVNASGGFSYNAYNFVVVATKVFGKTREVGSVMQTTVHEIGHQLGMVPGGPDSDYIGNLVPNYKGLDRPVTFYGNNVYPGHVGSHCKSGADDDNGTRCVMYGANHDRKTPTFCDVCAKCLKKLDVITNRQIL